MIYKNALNYNMKKQVRGEKQGIISKHNYNAASLPVPGLTCYAGQDEAQAETNEGVDGSDNPKGGSDGPGGLVENSADHGYDDNESEACNGPDLCRADAKKASEHLNITTNPRNALCLEVCLHKSVSVFSYPENLLCKAGPPLFNINPQSNRDKKRHESDTWGNTDFISSRAVGL